MNNLTTEKWLPVRGYEGLYEVSDSGRVRRLPGSPKCIAGREIKAVCMRRRGGYMCVGLWKDGAGRMARLHRLVLDAFAGPIPDGHEGNHRDGDRQNNALANLEIVTPRENIDHAMRAGLVSRGERSASAVLTEGIVHQILELYSYRKISYKRLAARFGFRWEYVRDVITGRTWGHITGRKRNHARPGRSKARQAVLEVDSQPALCGLLGARDCAVQ